MLGHLRRPLPIRAGRAQYCGPTSDYYWQSDTSRYIRRYYSVRNGSSGEWGILARAGLPIAEEG